MAFPPHFLDEIRARLPLADIVGRRVQLRKHGREYTGLCPFHSEKTPSFTVSEDKGFFHCFGCGAHGDVIGFVMRTGNLSFPETVERLAQEAGLEVPRSTPEERQRAERAKTLYEVMEATCAWYEGNLRGAEGRVALDYLRGRGLDDETIARFRLGFAPDRRDGIRMALMPKGFEEPLLVSAGLIAKPEDGSGSYDRFRGRVMFPITDRRGRPIAFGGRILDAFAPGGKGRSVAKYLNSPDTDLFHKGRVLYAVDKAWAGARDGAEVVVAEGYMDVIALHKAGFRGAVAPLGTALTEAQIELLWRMAPEPVLCFDGDEAGHRAAARAAERALPLLRPGYSLRFAMLPAGEDPDTLIAGAGTQAMQRLVERARPLVDLVWEMETSRRPADTPERRAKLREAVRRHAWQIADRTVQEYYLTEFDTRLAQAFGRTAPRGRRTVAGQGRGRIPAFGRDAGLRADGNTEILALRQQQVLLAAPLNHPELLHEFTEVFCALELEAPELDKLRQEIIKTLDAELDTGGVKSHLIERGYSGLLDRLLGEEVYGHGAFARPDASLEAARRGWLQLVERFHRRRHYDREMDAAIRALTDNPNDQNRAYLDRLREQGRRADEPDWEEATMDPAREG